MKEAYSGIVYFAPFQSHTPSYMKYKISLGRALTFERVARKESDFQEPQFCTMPSTY